MVKLALGVFVTAFALIWGGMYLSRPDRSIPPYSVGSQEGTAIAVHVPGWTSDAEIETLIARFRKVGRETGDFGPMKFRPTTPDDPLGRYRSLRVYIFTHDAWAEPDILHKYLEALNGLSEDRSMKDSFENAVRGFYRVEDGLEEGRIGSLLTEESAATAAFVHTLFKGPVTAPISGEASPESEIARPAPAPLPSPTTSATPGL